MKQKIKISSPDLRTRNGNRRVFSASPKNLDKILSAGIWRDEPAYDIFIDGEDIRFEIDPFNPPAGTLYFNYHYSHGGINPAGGSSHHTVSTTEQKSVTDIGYNASCNGTVSIRQYKDGSLFLE